MFDARTHEFFNFYANQIWRKNRLVRANVKYVVSTRNFKRNVKNKNVKNENVNENVNYIIKI